VALYDYRCPSCNLLVQSLHRADTLDRPCTRCGHEKHKRVWGFRMGRVMHEHFNASVGRPISDPKQFRAELRRKSDEMSERTGMVHNYVEVDPSEPASLGVTAEGLDETARAKHDSGEMEKVPWRV
jgi:hypothetical protein